MQQRPSSSTRATDEQSSVKMAQQQLPIYCSQIGRIPRSRFFPLAEKWVHAIPFIIFLCFCILWWFSHPVNVVMEDGRIVAIQEIEKAQDLNNTRIELAILASATSPIASIPLNLTTTSYYNETEAHPVSETN